MNKKTLMKLCLGAAAVALPLFVLAPGAATKRQKSPFYGLNFAHRGLHSRDKSVPENSLEAFRLAAEAGYGMELDVQLSKDGQVVVFHDDTLDRVCGVHGRVDEFSFEELQQMRLCGTAHRIPLFSEVLDVVRGRGALIVELKTGPRNAELCAKTCALLHAYDGPVCIESFDPRIVTWFRFHAPEFFRGQLAQLPEEYEKSGMSRAKAFVLGHTMLNAAARPEFIAYRIGPRPASVRLAEALGAVPVGWTSHDPADEEGRGAVIFEFCEPKPRYLWMV
jgi:glycerophosphoryl diester phosphodiesterase